MNNIVSIITSSLGKVISKEVLVVIISFLPILELRGGMIAGALLKIPYPITLLLCMIGNLLPIPFILIFLNHLLIWMEKWKLTSKIAIWLRKKAEKNRKLIDKYGFWGLVLFVAIPLPGSGAWTGALVASVLRMDIKKACLAIVIGVIGSASIMSFVAYGLPAIVTYFSNR